MGLVEHFFTRYSRKLKMFHLAGVIEDPSDDTKTLSTNPHTGMRTCPAILNGFSGTYQT